MSLDLGTSRSSTDTSDRTRAAPQIATADSQTAVSPATDSQPSRRADLDLTPAEQAALEQAEAVQLVSIHQHNDFYAAAIAVVAAPEKLKTNPGGSSKLDFSFDAQRFEDLPLERFLEQSKSLEEDIAELEELLDAITLERTESAQHRDSAIRPMIPAEQQTDTIVESPSEDAADGMILLLPGASLANPTAQFAAQVFDRPDDSAISQWTVGVGFYRALEVVGDARFADALIASEISINPTPSAAAENELAETFSWQLDTVSSSRQAAGVVFCCLGIQYLRNRRKETNELEIRSVPRDEATLD